jgi:translation initiation factor 3 subunit H
LFFVNQKQTQTGKLTRSRKETPLKAVQVEGLVGNFPVSAAVQDMLTCLKVVMKIIKHCSSRFPTTATGALVGMDVNGTLEITNTFPLPIIEIPQEAHYEGQHINTAAAAPRAKANTGYQAEMIRMLREVNIDAQSVGWYTSANMGNFCNINFIENQYYYQKDLNERTVALVNDVSRSSQGALSLRAFRLSPQFMAAYKENKFTTEKSAAFSLLPR